MNRNKKTVIFIVLHIVMWLVFLSLPTLFNPRREDMSLGGFIDDLLEPPRWTNGLLLVTVFYFNYYIAIPKFYLRRKYLGVVLSFVGCFAIFFLLNAAMRPPAGLMPHPPGFPLPPDRFPPGMYFLGNSFNLFMFIIVYAVSFTLRVYEQWQHTKQEMLNTQIRFLKAQINPHFLFNTLNNIYALTLTKSDEASDAVVKLSGMMRYAVSDSGQDRVQLSKEIEYISNYIGLQQLRLADKVRISYEVQGYPVGKQIAPFLLIPFIENAFKYGVNPDEDSDICIDISISESGINMQVCNNKVYVRMDKDKAAGLGINTTQKRLEMLYPDRHILTINNNDANFNVSLQIQLL